MNRFILNLRSVNITGDASCDVSRASRVNFRASFLGNIGEPLTSSGITSRGSMAHVESDARSSDVNEVAVYGANESVSSTYNFPN